MSVPVIASPMFLVSGTQLVIECCKAGVAGTFPALNARTTEIFDEWLAEITSTLAASETPTAPFGVNLILLADNRRRDSDIELVVRHRVPFVITSLGNPVAVVEAVHGYGGVVFSDVVHSSHARKAVAAGVDGIVAVASGAGGHAGAQSAFSLVREIREFWKGTLVLGGAIGDGNSVRAAEVLGADFAYMGTRFLATKESLAQKEFKQMILESGASDIVYTDSVSGHHANILKKSLEQAQAAAQTRGDGSVPKAWRDVWSAGHGVATIHDIPSVSELVARLAAEYQAACRLQASAALASAAHCIAEPYVA